VLSLCSHAYLTGRVNWGDGRDVPRQHIDGVKVHRSVKIRMGADFLEGGEYSPNAKVEVDPEWID
jgi:hypothetical protein